MKLSERARQEGVNHKTAWKWFKAGILPVEATPPPTGTILVEEPRQDRPLSQSLCGNGFVVVDMSRMWPVSSWLAAQNPVGASRQLDSRVRRWRPGRRRWGRCSLAANSSREWPSSARRAPDGERP